MENYIFALGYFDGVHLGHRRLLEQCRVLAGAAGLRTGAVTFADHPDALVLGRAPVLINTPADRERLLLRWVDRVVTLPFDGEMLATPWDTFLDMLREEKAAAGFVCGDDFRFGAGGKGSPELLGEYCRDRGLPWAVVPAQTLEGTRISSTYIRTALEEGRIREANRFLGHPHMLTGTVIPGRQLGRTLGIPTANLALPEGLAIPRFGVYACRAYTAQGCRPAVVNIGTRPTVAGKGITVEPWLLNFAGDLYGQELRLEFLEFLRPEMKFETLEALSAEIRRNAGQTLALLDREEGQA